uniref:Uncharacterized protein n=1 Tax=Heterosigma akashiwo TaxID=2829 RepID=A0A6V1RZ10_HETAK
MQGGQEKANKSIATNPKDGYLKDKSAVGCYSCSGVTLFSSMLKEMNFKPVCIGIPKQHDDVVVQPQQQTQSSKLAEQHPQLTSGFENSLAADDAKTGRQRQREFERFYFACIGYSQTEVSMGTRKSSNQASIPSCEFGLNMTILSTPKEPEDVVHLREASGGNGCPDLAPSVNPTKFKNSNDSSENQPGVGKSPPQGSEGRSNRSRSGSSGDSVWTGFERWTSSMGRQLSFMRDFSGGLFDDFGSRWVASAERLVGRMHHDGTRLGQTAGESISSILPTVGIIRPTSFFSFSTENPSKESDSPSPEDNGGSSKK